MKKNVSIIGLLVLFFMIIFIFCSCGNEQQEISTTNESAMVDKSQHIEENNIYETTIIQNDNETSTILENDNSQNQKLMDVFAVISQYPELPTGCEMTSLTMVLNYYGINADKCDISDNFLLKGDVGTVDFNVAFVGNPRDSSSYGCYSPVVVNAANSYLAYKDSKLLAVDISGVELEDLFSYIDNNTPVIVWGTQDCKEGHYSVTWNVDGKDLTWFTPEHCMVLVGYDDNNVWVADPIYGELRSYDIYTFKNAYNSLAKQAVVLK